MSERLYEILSEHLSEHKRNLFEQVLSKRTRYLTIVIEDVYQAQNASALLRSAEAWGVQDVHIIENSHPFQQHKRVAKGAQQWLTLHRYNQQSDNSKTCFETLRQRGYQIVVTALSENSLPLIDLDLTKPTAIVLGTELSGVSTVAMQYADATMAIPMHGFTESLNVSVAGAVIIQQLTVALRKLNVPWQLSESEKLELRIQWARQCIHWSDYLLEMYESGEIQ